jgi:hypothetical protein
MLQGVEDVQKSFYPAMALEVTLIKLSLLHTIVPLDDILGKIEALYRKIRSGNPSSQLVDESQEKQILKSINNPISESGLDYTHTKSEKSVPSLTDSSMEEFIKFVKSKKPITGTHLEHANKISSDSSTLKIEFSYASIHSDHLLRQDAQENLKKLSKEFFGQDLRVKVEIKSLPANETNHQSLKEQNARNKEEIQKDPIVQDALEIFEGRIVKIKTKEKE